MSTVINDVAAPANVTPEVSEPTSFAEFQKTWTPEQRREWDATGKEPETTAPAKTESVEPTPEAEKAKVEPASGAGEEDQDHEPEYFGTPEQIKKQKHAFARQKRLNAELKAELKLLREQRTERPAATVAAPKVETPRPGRIAKPELPDITDEKYAVDGGAKAYQNDLKEFFRLDKLYDRQEAADQRETEQAQRARRERDETWANELKAGREAHDDFDKVAFNPMVPASDAMLHVISGTKGAAELFYYLGQNPEHAKELTELTHIPGFQSYDELAEAAKDDHSLKVKLGIAEGLVRAEIKRIQSGKTKTPDPKPITVSRTVPPAEKVNAAVSITKDPIAEAWAQYDKTGDHKYLRLANKLEDERDKVAYRRS